MTQNEAEHNLSDFNRREFIKATSFGSLMLAVGGIPLQAETTNAPLVNTNYSTIGAPVSCAVIGCGVWGREVIQTLGLLPNAPVVAICDIYKPFLNRSKDLAPKAAAFEDYNELLQQKNVEAVVIATPTHQHREIAVAALKAGKHVYCEIPLAHTIEDARAIAKAAKAAEKLNFQVGLQMRSDPVKYDVLKYIRNGAIGDFVMARSQWHNKQSWRRSTPNPDREKIVNWRLDKSVSTGLAGEIGVHQLDLISWFFNQHPLAVTGFGGIKAWNDGREVPDTIQSILQFPNNVNFSYDCTLANSFDADYDMLYGSFAAVMMRYEAATLGASENANRQSKAWLFKEADSPMLGLEIYATKEQFRSETGLALAAGSTKSVQSGHAAAVSPYAESALHYALKAFIQNSHLTSTGVSDFAANYGADADGVREYLASLSKSRLPAASFQEGYEATVTALKTNEAVLQGQKIVFEKNQFEI